MKTKWIILSYEKNEYLPTFVGVGHNLKLKNTYKTESKLLLNTPNHHIICKKFLIGEKEVSVILTHSETKFIRGFLYYNGKEHEVIDHIMYSSLQIEDYAYDNISGIQLNENPF